ncbi:MAG TPA: heparan-alpha-glucosaminide N-acetyltransferase domain-containing protein [Mycobacteriales bacterium]|nr:heparan-alpha-glucosaminide N-acetyltransferase domain-containing protein [Mycobacteriales bacterium]
MALTGTGTRRLAGVDAARGTALLGMTAVHTLPATEAGRTTLAHLVAAGRSAALFAVLAGVGVALATGGRRPVEGERRRRWRLALVVRGLLVGAVGLAVAELDTGVAVILAYYAVLFALAVPLLGLRPRALLAVAAAVAVLVPVVSQAVRPGLGLPVLDSPTVGTVRDDPVALLETLLLTGYYPALAWTAYLALGLAVGRLALGRPRTAAVLALSGAVLAAAASAASALLLGPLGGLDRIAQVTDLDGRDVADVVAESRFGTVPTTTWWWLATDAPHSTTPLDLLHTAGTALLVLGVLLLLVPRARRLLDPLAAAGSMPLTLYCAHLVVLALVAASGLAPDPLLLWLAQVVLLVAAAAAWRRRVGRGPLEAGVAAVTRRVVGRT